MVNLYKQDGEAVYGLKEYIVDTPDDIAQLPTNIPKIKVGSTALVISTGELYMLDSAGVWGVFPRNDGGNGGGSSSSGQGDNGGVLIEF